MIIFIYLFVIGVTAVTVSEPSATLPTVEEAKESQLEHRPELGRK